VLGYSQIHVSRLLRRALRQLQEGSSPDSRGGQPAINGFVTHGVGGSVLGGVTLATPPSTSP
jgi:hypothetical protein